MKHIFIFNGGAATGKTKLCNLMSEADDLYVAGINARVSLDGVVVKDNFTFYDYSKNKVNKEKIRNFFNIIENGIQLKYTDNRIYPHSCILVCMVNKNAINLLIDYIEDYYDAYKKERPNISYVEFNRM